MSEAASLREQYVKKVEANPHNNRSKGSIRFFLSQIVVKILLFTGKLIEQNEDKGTLNCFRSDEVMGMEMKRV